MQASDRLSANVHCLRKLPVDFQLAPQQVLATIAERNPTVIVCCGMAEQRSRLTVESNGTHAGETLTTTVNIMRLIENLQITEISHDAGDFVCNHLYYSILKFIQCDRPASQCIFVHVPILNQINTAPILADFARLLQRLEQQETTELHRKNDPVML